MSSGFSSNKEWTKFFSNENGDYYYDKKGMKKRGDFVYVWELSDYLNPIVGEYFSSIGYKKIDCLNKRYTPIKKLYFTELMGKGLMKDNSDIYSSGESFSLLNMYESTMNPHSVSTHLFNVLCK